MAITPKVVRFRKYETDRGLLGFFDFIVDDTIVVCENTLLRTKAGKLRWSSASKQRLDKDKQPVIVDGYAKWDDYCRLYTEKAEGEEKGKPTEAAWTFYNSVLAQAKALYEGEGSSERGRGAAKRTTATPAAKAAVKATTGATTEDGELPEDDPDSDDLPFN